jgi:aminoglycoside phosphotransferase (APT) family kinase protein
VEVHRDLGSAANEAAACPDAGALASWLSEALGAPVAVGGVRRLAGGHSSGAWLVDASVNGAPRPLVLKAPRPPSLVYRFDAIREAHIAAALAKLGAPVPHVVAIDVGTRAAGCPCFAMEYVDGRSVPDTPPAAYHAGGWFREAARQTQCAVWLSFHDALARLHGIDAALVPEAQRGPGGVRGVLGYWREALLDALPAAAAPRHLAMLDWLLRNVPANADEAPAVCLGDARLANGIVAGSAVRALVDFEVAYAGNPAADVGYSLFVDRAFAANCDAPIELPSADQTWAPWSRATGRALDDCDYWTAFGATIIVVTATRALVQWGVPLADVERTNLLVAAWEAAVERAAR